MEKIEFYPNEFLVIEEKLIPEKNIPHLPQCLEKQSWLSKFKNLFKKKETIVTWFDVEKEILHFLDKYKIDSHFVIYPQSTINLTIEHTKKFIKKFDKKFYKYKSYHWASYDKRYAENKEFILDEKSIGQILSFNFLNTEIYIKIVE